MEAVGREELRHNRFNAITAAIERVVTASCAKYAWLLPLLLAQARDADQQAYFRAVDPEAKFRQRGLGLAFLVAWRAEATALADALGL